MEPWVNWRPPSILAWRQEAARDVRTAKDLLLSGQTEANIERCFELVSRALTFDRCTPGGNALFVAVTALRATDLQFLLPSGDVDPYAVFGLDPAYSTYRDPALIQSYYRQAFDLLNSCHPSDPCSAVFADAARIVDDAWAFLMDPDRKAALDSTFEAPPPPPQPLVPRAQAGPDNMGRGKRAKESKKSVKRSP